MEAEYYNALNALYKGSYSKLQKLWEQYGNWKKIWEEKGKENIHENQEWKKVLGLGASLIVSEDNEYPELLKEIPLPPHGIYVLGKIEYKQPAVAIVGTRAATPQGKELARSFARKLSSAGITIISGLAMGIDQAAHQGVLEENGKTIAVLGTPINHIYPKQNEQLAANILKNGGAIISEFPTNQEYHPQNFLIRNRIISGLSNAILVIEAPERSGSLATARFALEQNREIFVIPGNISSQNYRGSNSLIKAGANIITDPEDILNHLGIQIASQKNELKRGENEIENAILNTLQKEKASIEQLMKYTKINPEDLNKSLAMLIIKGIIKESNNGKYYLNS